MNKCCGNCAHQKPAKLKIQFNEIPMTQYCANKDSQYYGKYVWGDDVCEEWKGVDDERI